MSFKRYKLYCLVPHIANLPRFMEEQLDECQKMAVLSDIEKPLKVLAGPGSGKTRTMCERIRHMINNKNVSHDDIYVTTFTRDAVKEIKKRLMDQLSGVSTIHGLCRYIINKFQAEGSDILSDEKGDDNIMKECCKFITTDARNEIKFIEFNDENSLRDEVGNAKESTEKKIKKIVLDNTNDSVETLYKHLCSKQMFEKNSRLIYSNEHVKTIAFSKLLPRALYVFEKSTDDEKKEKMKSKYYIVDEFQDTDYGQLELFKVLCSESGRFTCVGDIDQSIYEFRGANPIILHKGVDTIFNNMETIILTSNYRSSKNIVNLTQALINNNEKNRRAQYEVNPVRNAAEKKVDILETTSNMIEAKRILHVIQETAKEQNDWNHAVLFYKEKQCDFFRAYMKKTHLMYVNNQRIKNITCTTIHKAKGMEWDCVYVGGIDAEWIFGYNRDERKELSHREINKVEEKRRLFYVACTRAKSYLHISYYNIGNEVGNANVSNSCCFIDEIKACKGEFINFMRIHDQDHTTGGQNAIEEFLQRRFKTDCFAVDDAINEACNNISQKYDIGLDKIQDVVRRYLPENEGNILRIDGLLDALDKAIQCIERKNINIRLLFKYKSRENDDAKRLIIDLETKQNNDNPEKSKIISSFLQCCSDKHQWEQGKRGAWQNTVQSLFKLSPSGIGSYVHFNRCNRMLHRSTDQIHTINGNGSEKVDQVPHASRKSAILRKGLEWEDELNKCLFNDNWYIIDILNKNECNSLYKVDGQIIEKIQAIERPCELTKHFLLLSRGSYARICIKLNSECNLLEEKIFKVGNSDVTFKPAMSKNLIATVFYNGADDINQLKRWMKNINLALCFEVEAHAAHDFSINIIQVESNIISKHELVESEWQHQKTFNGVILFQAEFNAQDSFYKENDLDQSVSKKLKSRLENENLQRVIAFSTLKPDYIRMSAQPAYIELEIIDAKASKCIKLEHKVQVGLYSLVLQDIIGHLAPNDYVARNFKIAPNGGVFLPPHRILHKEEKYILEQFALKDVEKILKIFLSKQIKKVLSEINWDGDGYKNQSWQFQQTCSDCQFSQNCHDESMKDKRLSFIPNLNETYYNFFQNKLPDIENVGDHIGENDNLDEITKLSKHVLIPPRNAQEWKANRYGLCIKYDIDIINQEENQNINNAEHVVANDNNRELSPALKIAPTGSSPKILAIQKNTPYLNGNKSTSFPNNLDVAVYLTFETDPQTDRLYAYAIKYCDSHNDYSKASDLYAQVLPKYVTRSEEEVHRKLQINMIRNLITKLHEFMKRAEGLRTAFFFQDNADLAIFRNFLLEAILSGDDVDIEGNSLLDQAYVCLSALVQDPGLLQALLINDLTPGFRPNALKDKNKKYFEQEETRLKQEIKALYGEEHEFQIIEETLSKIEKEIEKEINDIVDLNDDGKEEEVRDKVIEYAKQKKLPKGTVEKYKKQKIKTIFNSKAKSSLKNEVLCRRKTTYLRNCRIAVGWRQLGKEHKLNEWKTKLIDEIKEEINDLQSRQNNIYAEDVLPRTVVLMSEFEHLIALPDSPGFYQIASMLKWFDHAESGFKNREKWHEKAKQISNIFSNNAVFRDWSFSYIFPKNKRLENLLEYRLLAMASITCGLRSHILNADRSILPHCAGKLYLKPPTKWKSPLFSKLFFITQFEDISHASKVRDERKGDLDEKLQSGKAFEIIYNKDEDNTMMFEVKTFTFAPIPKLKENSFAFDFFLFPKGIEQGKQSDGELSSLRFPDLSCSSNYYSPYWKNMLFCKICKHELNFHENNIKTSIGLNISKYPKHLFSKVKVTKHFILQKRHISIKVTDTVAVLQLLDNANINDDKFNNFYHLVYNTETWRPNVEGEGILKTFTNKGIFNDAFQDGSNDRKLARNHCNSLSVSQREVFDAIFTNRLIICWGPPGAGKTYFAAHSILALIHAAQSVDHKYYNVLVTAQTNTGVDNLKEKLEKEIEKECYGNNIPVYHKKTPLKEIPSKSFIYCGTVFNIRTTLKKFERKNIPTFDLIIVDEASQMKLQELAFVMQYLDPVNGRILVVGDHLQLRPIFINEYPKTLLHEDLVQLDTSILTFFRDKLGEDHVLSLKDNYRMSETLAKFTEITYPEYTYKHVDKPRNILKLPFEHEENEMNSTYDSVFTSEKALQVVFLEYEKNDGQDRVYRREADFVCKLIRNVYDAFADDDDRQEKMKEIFIITPHHAQQDLINARLPTFKVPEEVKNAMVIKTAECVQGKEAELVIICYSYVDFHSNETELDFIYDLNRLNVAVTRAKERVIFVTTKNVVEDASLELLAKDARISGYHYIQNIVKQGDCRTILENEYGEQDLGYNDNLLNDDEEKV